MVARATAQLNFNFDEVKTRSVEKLIFELINEVTSITETYPLPKGKSPDSLVVAVEKSVQRFVQNAERAVSECPQAQGEALSRLRDAILDVQDTCQAVSQSGRDFVRDSSNSQRRHEAVQAGRGLLQAIAHLLIIADMLDVSLLISVLDKVRASLDHLRNASSNQEVVDRYSIMMTQIEEMEETIKRRIGDLRDPQQRDDLLAARGLLQSSCPMVYASTKAFVRHPESDESRRNRDFAHAQAATALDAMQDILSGRKPEMSYTSHGHISNLAGKLDEFQANVYMDPASYKGHVHRRLLEEMLEDICEGAGILADSDSTRKNRHDAITNECNNVRQALQDLLSEYERNCGRHDPSEDVDLAMVQVGKKTKDLRRQLRRAVVDHVSDAFLDTSTPLLALVAAAESRDPERTRLCGHHFEQHAAKLIDVANLACEMSSDVEGVRIIRHTAQQLKKMAPEVVDAAHLLCARGDSEVAKQNMQVYKEAWLDKVRLLTMAIDSIMTLDDFLAVSEAHIAEDAMHGLEAVHVGDCDLLDRSAGAIRGRALRVCSVVDNEMDALPASSYADRIKTATKRLKDDKLREFASRAEGVLRSVETSDRNPQQTDRDSDELIDACTLVHNAVKDIRNALLLNRNPDEVDSDNEYEEDGQTVHDTASRVSEGENQQKVMRRLPEEDKKKIQEQIDVFKITQTKFEREVAKWDETGNDIIVLAKHMCMIMMNMTDFTRGRGPLKTTMDVIGAAQEISIAGEKLKTLATQIGEESADSYTKQDLVAYLSKIPLYCQQLNICSKVKADVQQVGDELVVSGLDSAMSLIQTARNLLSAVVMTVKAAYIASTKFPRANSSGVRVEWRMAPPQKQPLVRSTPPKNASVIRRASERRPMRPAQALAEFVQ